MLPLLAVLKVPFTGFDLPNEVLVLGVMTGLGYGLLAVGLTLIYKGARVINFAQGALGVLPGLLLPVLVYKAHLGYWLATPLALLVGIGGGVLLEFAVIRRLRNASRLVVMVATIAAAQILGVFGILLPDDSPFMQKAYPEPFHWSGHIGSLRLGAGHILVLVVAPALAIGVSLFLRYTKLGLAARAAAENRDAALMTGIPVKQVSLVIWALAGLFAASAGILDAGIQPRAAATAAGALGGPLLVRGLAAALLGGFDRLSRVFLAGVVIGVVELLVQWNYATAGIFSPLLLVAILVALFFHRGLASAARDTAASSWALAADIKPLPPRLAADRRVAWARTIGLIIVVGGTAVLAAVLSPSQRVLLSSVLIWSMMGLSLVVLTGYAGQITLGHYAFVAMGAIVGGRMATLGFPSGSAIGYAIAACGGLALIIGVPALRVRGLFLAVTTLAFAVAAETWLYQQDWLVKSSGVTEGSTSLIINRPTWFGIDLSSEVRYAWLCLAVLTLMASLVHRLRRTGLGRAMVAVRDNEAAAATMSLSPRRVKITAFVLSGALAGLAGYFYGGLLVNFSAATSGLGNSLNLVIMVILGGVTTVTGAILGALWIKGIPYVFGANVGLLSGAFGVLVVLLIFPGGLASVAFRWRDRFVKLLTGEDVARLREPTRSAARPSLPPRDVPVDLTDGPPILVAKDVVVAFGGNRAVDGVSVHVASGEILGLLGPNGAGKTTLFDVLSGHLRPTSGQVELRGEDITDLRPEERAHLGMGRTFQQARLFDGLTVLESVQVALERTDPTHAVPSLLALPPSWRGERRKRQRAKELVELLGLGPYESRQISELSTGMRRLAELACVVAVAPDVILLDEPTAGIAQAEVEQFTPVIGQIKAHLGATLVIVEHDIPLMMSLVDRLYVLASGQVIAEGPPALVRTDPGVISAYLGSDDRVVARSGRDHAPAARRRRRQPLTATKVTSGGTS
jgi:ABC-type branched-subunit amino acid transport system ATPase component/ABC-type branched-subunit amino acid transport system permease subunit